MIFLRFGVGQNLYIYKQTLKAANNDWVKAVTDWYDEVALFRNKDVEPFSFSLETGHYTQVDGIIDLGLSILQKISSLGYLVRD